MKKIVKEFNEKYMKPLDINIRMHDIVSEAGELAKEVIKGQDYGSKPFEKTDNFEGEIGDCLYSIISLANENGIDAEIALVKAIQKYKDRIEKKGHSGSN